MTSRTHTSPETTLPHPISPDVSPDISREVEINQAAAYGAGIRPAQVGDGTLYWKVVDVRHLSADENRGKHHVFVRALDESGARLHDPDLHIAWTWEGRKEDERADPRPLDKPEGELGHGNIDLFKNQHTEVWLEGENLPSERVLNLHTDHEAAEKTSDGQDGNTRFHHSFVVTFQRTRKPAAPIDVSGTGTTTVPLPPSPPPSPSVVTGSGTAAPAAVDQATFLREEDATPDGTTVRPGDRFSKTWVLRNTGTTGWTPDYRLVWIGGDSLGAPSSIAVPATQPGTEARITVDFAAPQGSGRRRSLWQLASANGVRFGDTVWADIQIASLTESGFAAPAGKQILLPAGAAPVAQAVAQTWNRYGGLVLEESERLGIDPAAAIAVLVAESRGEPFAGGRMTIRFENHLFYQYWGKEHESLFRQHFAFDPNTIWQGHTWRPDPAQAMRPCHTGNLQEWEVLDFARRLDDTAALKCISMGASQVMGFNHASVGYSTPQAMFQAFEHDAGAQMRALFRFMEVNNLVDAVRRQDYRRFAEVYNGPGQVAHYESLMRDYAATFKNLMPSAPRALTPQAAGPGEKPRAPMPTSPKPGVPLSESDPELYAAWREHIANGFRANDTMFKRVLDAFMNPYWTTVWMYRILFAVGVIAFVVAAALAFRENTLVTTLVFGGLSVGAFLGYFVSRPLQALEENLQFITWLGIIYNTYWSQLVQAQDPATFAQELDKATDTAISRIQTLMNKHTKRSGARPSIRPADQP